MYVLELRQHHQQAHKRYQQKSTSHKLKVVGTFITKLLLGPIGDDSSLFYKTALVNEISERPINGQETSSWIKPKWVTRTKQLKKMIFLSIQFNLAANVSEVFDPNVQKEFFNVLKIWFWKSSSFLVVGHIRLNNKLLSRYGTLLLEQHFYNVSRVKHPIEHISMKLLSNLYRRWC